MSGSKVPVLLVAAIVIIILVICLAYPNATRLSASGTYTPFAPPVPDLGTVAMTPDTTYGDAEIFSGTAKSGTWMTVNAVIAAEIYDPKSLEIRAYGDSRVRIQPFGQSSYEITVPRPPDLPENWRYRVYVKAVS
jgi:hypothetical protein